jgi:O-antigen/teichoic acid export membrane protein
VLNWLLIPHLGALGSAIATFFTYVVLSGTYLLISQKLYYLPIEYPKLLIILTLLVLSIFIALWFNSLSWNWLVPLYKFTWMLAVGIVIYMFRIIDISQLKSILKSNK